MYQKKALLFLREPQRVLTKHGEFGFPSFLFVSFTAAFTLMLSVSQLDE
jgi:hypothetical protein